MAMRADSDSSLTKRYDRIFEQRLKSKDTWSYIVGILFNKPDNESNEELKAIVKKYGLETGCERNTIKNPSELISPVMFAKTKKQRDIFLEDWEEKGYFQNTKCPNMIEDILCHLSFGDESVFDTNVNELIILYRQLCRIFLQDDVLECFRSVLWKQHAFNQSMLEATKEEDVCPHTLYIYVLMITVVYMLDKENVDEDKLEIIRANNKSTVDKIYDLLKRVCKKNVFDKVKTSSAFKFHY